MEIELGLGINQSGNSVGYLATSFTSGDSTNKSATAELTITPTLYSALAVDFTVDLYVQGGHDSNVENYGVGGHYTLACAGSTITNIGYNLNRVRVTIAASETTKAITLTVVNNPVIELDRTLTIYAPNFGANKTVTIVDDSGGLVLNAVTDYATWGGEYGLVPDSEDAASNNGTALTAIVEYIKAIEGWDATEDQAIIYFPQGTYYLSPNVYLWPGIIIWGENKDTTILKRPSKQWFDDEEISTPFGSTYYMMFRHASSGDAGIIWNDNDNSKLGGFIDITFDGNYDSFDVESFEGYEFTHLLYASCKSSADQINNLGQNMQLLENVLFTNNLSSGFAYLSNVNATAYYVQNTGGAPDKGDYSFVGGNTTANFRLVTGWRQVDWEQTGATSGHYLDSRMNITLNYCDMDRWQLGLYETATGTQTVTGNYCTMGNLAIGANAADIVMNYCTATLTEYGSTNDTYLKDLKSFTADNCIFNMYEGSGVSQGIKWNSAATSGGEWKFTNCAFNKLGTWSGLAYAFDDLTSTISQTKTRCILNLVDCTFDGFQYVVITGNGGCVKFDNPILTNCYGLLNAYVTGTYTGAFTFANMVDANFDENFVVYLLTRQSGTLVPDSDIIHTMDGETPTVVLPSTKCLIMSGYVGNDGAGIRGYTYTGLRRITGTSPATTITGLPGDQFYDTDTSAVTHTVVVEGDGNESKMGYLKVRDGVTYFDTTWTGV